MIYIFGDSYGDENKNSISHNDKTYPFSCLGPYWYDYLRTHERTINYSKAGTGPYYSFDKFYSCYEDGTIKKGDKFVFILSSPHRIGNNNLGDLLLSKHNIPEQRELEESFEGKPEDIRTVYNYLQREVDFINYKNISFLKFFSQLNESKIIVFRAFDNKSFDIDTREYPEDLYDLSILNDMDFYLYPKLLFNITVDEVVENDTTKLANWGEFDGDEGLLDVGRKNHLSEYNHKILSNIIINFFYNTDYDETFKKKFYVKENKNLNEFIYDQ